MDSGPYSLALSFSRFKPIRRDASFVDCCKTHAPPSPSQSMVAVGHSPGLSSMKNSSPVGRYPSFRAAAASSFRPYCMDPFFFLNASRTEVSGPSLAGTHRPSAAPHTPASRSSWW